jgi:hypothetical protein
MANTRSDSHTTTFTLGMRDPPHIPHCCMFQSLCLQKGGGKTKDSELHGSKNPRIQSAFNFFMNNI